MKKKKAKKVAVGGKCGKNLEAGDSEKVRATIWIVIRGNAGT